LFTEIANPRLDAISGGDSLVSLRLDHP